MGDIVGPVLGFMAAEEQADATESAGEQSAAAARYAADLQKEMFDRQVSMQEPWRLAGQNALNRLSSGLSRGGEFDTPFSKVNWQQDPGYQFRLSEGLNALNRQSAARGGLISGGALKAAMRYGQDLGSQEYQNAANRYWSERQMMLNPLESLSGVGQTTARTLGDAGSSYAGSAGDLAMRNAENMANATIQGGNIRASQYGQVSNLLNSDTSKGFFSKLFS